MKIIIFSSLPPPIGGVTKSVENLMQALKIKSVENRIVENFFTITPFFSRYDIAHIHYSKSWKRLLGLLLGKMVAKKVIFTLHGNLYKQDLLNELNAKLTDGVIFLNETAKKKYTHKFKNVIVLSSIFSEGYLQKKLTKKRYFERKKGKIYLLFYAFDKIYQNSKDIYGGDFILKNFLLLDNKYVLVFVDINSGYTNEVGSIKSDSLIYINHEVDFISLLQEIDIYIRPTTTDGSSVALQEALLLGKNVLASDVVKRPREVTLYKSENFLDFAKKMDSIQEKRIKYSPNSIVDYISFCKMLLE